MNILVTVLNTLYSFFYFNIYVASPSVDRNIWRSGEEQYLFLTPGLKDDNFLPLAHTVPMWKETLASEEERDGCTEFQRIYRNKW